MAYRQTAGPGSPLPGPRVFLNMLPDGESADGSQFIGATIADPEVAGGASAVVGPPSVDIDEKQSLRLLYDSNGVPRVVEGNDKGLSGALSLGPPFAGAEPYAASVMNPEGGGVSAWPSVEGQGHPAVGVREDFPSGAVQTALVSGGAGGEVGELAVGRSGLGDGLIAFRQGQLGNAAIVAARATAPPQHFVVTVPKGWARPSRAIVAWLSASSANGPLEYRVLLDGRPQNAPTSALSLALNTRALSSGSHRVQVLASDIDGQSTLTPPTALEVDGTPPKVTVAGARGGHAVVIRVRDPNSGVAKRYVSVSFGDGSRARRRTRFAHRYAHAGIYRVTVHVRDKAGNASTVRQWVSVR